MLSTGLNIIEWLKNGGTMQKMTEARKKEISRSLVAYFCSDGNIDIGKLFIDIRCIPDRLRELIQATGISREELMEYWWLLPDRTPAQIIEYGFTGSRTR